MKLVLLKYVTKKGNEVSGKFIKTDKGYIPIVIDSVTFLDKSNKIIEEKDLEFSPYRKEMFF